MTAFHCEHCNLDFDADEARCPKCLRKRTVAAKASPDARSEPSAEITTDGTRTGLMLALVGVSLVLSMVGFGWMSWNLAELEQLRVVWPFGIGLTGFAIVAIRVAPRFAIESPRPLVTYASWLGISAAVGVSIVIAGAIAIGMASDVSVALTVVLAVVLWVGIAVPALGYALRRMVDHEKADGAARERPSGKWR